MAKPLCGNFTILTQNKNSALIGGAAEHCIVGGNRTRKTRGFFVSNNNSGVLRHVQGFAPKTQSSSYDRVYNRRSYNGLVSNIAPIILEQAFEKGQCYGNHNKANHPFKNSQILPNWFHFLLQVRFGYCAIAQRLIKSSSVRFGLFRSNSSSFKSFNISQFIKHYCNHNRYPLSANVSQTVAFHNMFVHQLRTRLTNKTACGNLFHGAAEGWSGVSQRLQVKSGDKPLTLKVKRFFCEKNNPIQCLMGYVQGVSLKPIRDFFSSCLQSCETLDNLFTAPFNNSIRNGASI